MRLIVATALLACVLASCKKGGGGAAPGPATTPAASASSQEAASRELVVVLGQRTLWDICEKRYGNGNYSEVIRLYNRFGDATKLRPDTKVRTPDLQAVVKDERLPKPLAQAAVSLLSARGEFVGIEKQLTQAKPGDPLPAPAAESLSKALSAAMAAQKLIASAASPQKTWAAGQVATLVEDLKDIQAGKIDENHYVVRDVQTRFANALAALIKWKREG